MYGLWYADYSNSSVGDAVYTNLEDAEAVARATGASLVEFTVNPPLTEIACKLRRPGERFHQVTMDYDGSNAQVWGDMYPPEVHPEEPFHVRVNKSKVDLVMSRCWAKDERHAIKIVNDRRIQWIVSGEHYLTVRVSGHEYGWKETTK